MRHIVLEGPDNAGKSTLAKVISEELKLPILHSGGPSKYPGEVEERAKRYLQLDSPVIFDRHPCVSQNIYVVALKRLALPPPHSDMVRASIRSQFYMQHPIIVYCRSIGNMDGHVVSEHTTNDYAKLVEEHYDVLLRKYDNWGLCRAHMLYRIGDPVDSVIKLLRGAL